MIKVSTFLFSKEDAGEPIEERPANGQCLEDWAANIERAKTDGHMKPVLDVLALPDIAG